MTATAATSESASATCTRPAAPATPRNWPRACDPGDVVLLHDPQTAGMVPRLRAPAYGSIWRAHIGLDLPNDLARDAWRFLTPYVQPADAYVFSRDAYRWPGLDEERVMVIPPSIDAFAPKNQAMAFSSVTAVLRAAGLAADSHQHGRAVFERLDGSVGHVEHRATMIEEAPLRLDTPLLAQVSRWDRLKDPLGVLAAFAEYVDRRGGAAAGAGRTRRHGGDRRPRGSRGAGRG